MASTRAWAARFYLAGMAILMWILRVPSDLPRNSRDVVYLRGTDAYYHLRHIEYITHNWPSTLQFDPFTKFPHGASVSRFGTLFDQGIATAAVLASAGHPDPGTTRLILAFSPVVLGILVLLPVYALTKRLAGVHGALFASTILALNTGVFFEYTTWGRGDHNAIEPLLQVTIIALLAYALTTNNHRYRRLFALSSGLVTAGYLNIWPPGVFMLTIIAAAVTITYALTLDDDTAAIRVRNVIAFSMPATTLAVFALQPQQTLGVVDFTALHAIAPMLVLAGSEVLYFLRNRTNNHYHATVAVLGGVALAVPWMLAPARVDRYVTLASKYVFFGTSLDASITEAVPFPWYHAAMSGLTPLQVVQSTWGFTLYTAGFALVVWGVHHNQARIRSELTVVRVLVGVWVVVVACAAFTQLRFGYYLAAPVAVLNGVLFTEVKDAIGVTGLDFSMHEALAVGVVPVIVLASVTVPAVAATTGTSDGNPISDWKPALDYLEDETPNPSKCGKLDYTKQYDRPVDGDYDYARGAYAVLSWWDYGHWITTLGERPAVSNPFQHHNHASAQVLLAPNDTAANTALSRVEEADAQVRYIVIDESDIDPDGKLPSIVQAHPELEWSDIERDSDLRPRHNQSFAVRLYTTNATDVPGYELVFAENGVKIFERTNAVEC